MAVSPQFSLRAVLLCIAVIAAALALVVLPLQRGARLTRAKNTKNALKRVGLAYHHCLSVAGAPPSRMQDLNQCRCVGPAAIQGIKDGGFVVFWNAEIRGPDNGMYVLGHEKDVPTRGGLVLMANGAVKHMTASEFQATPKVQKVAVYNAPPTGSTAGQDVR